MKFLLSLILIALLGLTSVVYAVPPTPIGTKTLNQALDGTVIVKSDATVLPVTRGLYVGDAAACNFAVHFVGGTTVTFVSAQPGSYHPLAVDKVMSTNTTCATMLALY